MQETTSESTNDDESLIDIDDVRDFFRSRNPDCTEDEINEITIGFLRDTPATIQGDDYGQVSLEETSPDHPARQYREDVIAELEQDIESPRPSRKPRPH